MALGISGGTFHLGDAVIRILADMDEFQSQMGETQTAMERVFKGMADVGKSLTQKVTLPIVGIGVASIAMAADFDQGMRNVNSILQLSEEGFQNLKKEVIEFGFTTRSSAADTATALYAVASAGFRGEEAFEVMSVAAHAAGAGMATTTDTTNILIAVLSAYGFEVERSEYLMNVFLQTVNQGLLTLPELAAVLGTIVPIGANLGVSIEEVNAALATITKTMPNANIAATWLRGTLTSLLKPSEALKNALAEMGYESGAAAIEAIGLEGVLKELSARYEDQPDQLAKLFNNVRAMQGAMTLLKDGASDYSQVLDQVMRAEEGLGAVDRAREQQYASLQTALIKVRRAFEAFLIQIGDMMTPQLTILAAKLEDFIEWLGRLSPTTLKVVMVIAGLAAAIGPLILIIAQLGEAIIGLQAILPIATAAMNAFGVSSVVALGPIVLLVAGLGLLLVKLAQSSHEFSVARDELLKTAESAEEYAEKTVELRDEMFNAEAGVRRSRGVMA